MHCNLNSVFFGKLAAINCFLFSTWKNVGMLDHSFGITVLIKTHHKFLNQQHPENNEFTRK